ncbi:ATP-binding protein [Streptomyces sp. NBC_00147]|uniref:ATP-binding protein n=1 Tax=Streptomyces sp. NBC_00147 TaxID=2975667 RepID=UPI00324F0734
MNSFTGTPSVASVVHLAMPPAMPSKIAAAGERETRVVPRLRKIGAAWLRHSCRMPEERVKDVLVVLSELLTNAVLHGTGDSVGYRSWSPEPGLIRFEIDDGTETEDPLPQAPSPMAESGRGLLLVSLFVKELGGDWGFTRHGTTAWCCLPIHDDEPVSGRREL